MTVSAAEQQQDWARAAIDRYYNRFGDEHLQLAYHAALPLVLTPELVNYLRVYFLQQRVPWVAEVDLLLSELCQPVGGDRYIIQTAVRAELLQQMKDDPEFGPARMQQVARLLMSYLQELSKADPYLQAQELQTQEWAALVYIPERQAQVTQQIAQSFLQAMGRGEALGEGANWINSSEMGRLAKLTQALSEQLSAHQDYQELIQYAEVVGQLLYGSETTVSAAALEQSYQVSGVSLPSLKELAETTGHDFEDFADETQINNNSSQEADAELLFEPLEVIHGTLEADTEQIGRAHV